MKSSVKTQRNKAFTLVEFLVVVLIVGILFVAGLNIKYFKELGFFAKIQI